MGAFKLVTCFTLIMLISVFLVLMMNAQIKTLIIVGVSIVLVFVFMIGLILGVDAYSALALGACAALLTASSMLAIAGLIKFLIRAGDSDSWRE